jgi:glucans biosynthesis protein C
VLGAAAVLTEHLTVDWQAGPTPVGALVMVLHTAITWVTLLAMLGSARRHLSTPTRVTPYLTRAAFPVYVLHQTAVVGVGYVVLGWWTSAAVAAPLILWARSR